MQRPLIWWRRGQRKPWPSIPRIDWSHPLAYNLTSYMYDCGGGVTIDLVQGNICVAAQKTTNGTASISNTPFGQAWSWSGTASNLNIGFNVQGKSDSKLNSVETPPTSAATGYFRIGNNTASNYAAVFNLSDASSNTPIWLASDPTNHPIFLVGNTFTTMSGITVPNGVFCTTGDVLTSSTSFTAYHIDPTNGFTSQTSTTTATGNTNLFPCMYNESNAGGDGGLNGSVFYGALWQGRALTPADFISLHQDPWQFLIYPEDEMLAALTAAAAAVTTPAFGWIPELPTLPWQKSRIKELSGPILSFRPSAQDIPWRNDGWEIQPPQPPHPRPERGAPLIRGNDGVDIFRNFFNFGWPVQPPQPPHPRSEKFGSIVPKDDGNQGTFQFWRNAGWEISPPMVRQPSTKLAGSIMPKDDGTQARFVDWKNAGWEIQSPQPPRPTQWRGAGFVLKDDGIADIQRNWQNAGWEVAPHQPQHPRPEKAGAIMPKEDGNEGIFVLTTAAPISGFDPNLPILRQVQRLMLAQPVDGLASYVNWQNSGWEIQSWQPPHPRPERFAAVAPREDGIAFPYISWFNAGWEIQAFQPPHTRWERAGGIMPIEPGNEGIFTFQVTTVLLGYDPVLPDLRRVLRRWLLAQPVDGIDYPLLGWQNAGWEIQPYQPQHYRFERSGGLMHGDDGTQSAFVNWANMGWEVQPPPPPHPRSERAGSLGTVFSIDGTFNPFVPSSAYEVQSPQSPRPWWERRTGALANLVMPPEPFVPPALTAWGYDPVFTYKLIRNCGLMAEMMRQGYDLTPFGFTDFGWPIQPWQPPHPRPEHGAALIFPFIELSDIVPPPPRTQIPMRTLVGMGL